MPRDTKVECEMLNAMRSRYASNLSRVALQERLSIRHLTREPVEVCAAHYDVERRPFLLPRARVRRTGSPFICTCAIGRLVRSAHLFASK